MALLNELILIHFLLVYLVFRQVVLTPAITVTAESILSWLDAECDRVMVNCHCDIFDGRHPFDLYPFGSSFSKNILDQAVPAAGLGYNTNDTTRHLA